MPTSLYALIGGGLVSAVLVPQTIRASRGADGGVAYINKLVTIAVVGDRRRSRSLLTIAAPLLMRLTVSDAATYDVAVPFAYWAMPQIFFLGMYAVLGEVLNARKRVRRLHVGPGREQRRRRSRRSRSSSRCSAPCRRTATTPLPSGADARCSPAARPSASSCRPWCSRSSWRRAGLQLPAGLPLAGRRAARDGPGGGLDVRDARADAGGGIPAELRRDRRAAADDTPSTSRCRTPGCCSCCRTRSSPCRSRPRSTPG